jgi:hypothetical protein
MSVKGSLGLIFVCLLFLTMPTLDKTYLFIYLFIVFVVVAKNIWREILEAKNN